VREQAPYPYPPQNLQHNSQFRWLFAGNTAMFFGFFGTLLLRSLLAWEITQDEMALAYINVLSAVCMFATSMVSGALIDRHERKLFLLAAQFAVFGAEAIILVLLVTGHISYGYLLISSVASSIAFPFIMPSRTAMLVTAVGRSKLARATALMTAGVNLARMISPAVIGILADVQGFIFCYSIILALHGTSLLCTFSLDRYPPPGGTRTTLLGETFKAFAYTIERPSLGLCIVFGMLPLLVVIPLQNLMVVFVDDIWQRGGSGLGIMMAATGLGGVIGSLAMGLLREGSLVKPMVWGTVAMGVVLLFFGHLPWFWLGVLAVFLIYSASVFSQTLVQTAVQLMSEDYIRGRITTITMMSISIAPVGTLVLAWATRHYGAPWTMTGSGVALILGVALFWGLLPAFRQIDRASQDRQV
jgi:predicted MFS family arabinose efflux permease